MSQGEWEYKKPKTQRIVGHFLKLLQGFPDGGIPFTAFSTVDETDQRVILRDLAELKTVMDEFGWEMTTPGPGKAMKGKEKKYFLHLPLLPETDDRDILLNLLMLERMSKKPWGKKAQQEEDHYRAIYQLVRYKYMTKYLEKMRERVVFVEPEILDTNNIADHIHKCLEAIGTERMMEISSGGHERRVWPLGLACRDDKWFLVCHAEDADKQIIFRLDRLQKTDILPERFQYPENFSLQELVQSYWAGKVKKKNSFTKVVITAKGEAADELKIMRLHPSQRIQEKTGEEVWVTFYLESWQEILNWVLRWGEQVEVLEPEELRQEMGKKLRYLAEKYTKT